MITELKIGDYIEKSELDTEQKYNDVVGVFGQWGAFFSESAVSEYRHLTDDDSLGFCKDGLWQLYSEKRNKIRKLTYKDIMSLKKVDVDNCNIDKVVNPCEQMVRNKTERDRKLIKISIDNNSSQDVMARLMESESNNNDETFREDTNCKEMVKAAKASLAMESLGYEYDEDKQQWFRREYL